MNTAKELQQQSIVERLWKEQEEAKNLIRKSIFRIIERAKGSSLSYDVKKQIDSFQELELLNAILEEIWNVKDSNKIWVTINKYDWLQEMNHLE